MLGIPPRGSGWVESENIEIITSDIALNYRTGSGSDLAVATDSIVLVVLRRPGRYRFLFCS